MNQTPDVADFVEARAALAEALGAAQVVVNALDRLSSNRLVTQDNHDLLVEAADVLRDALFAEIRKPMDYG